MMMYPFNPTEINIMRHLYQFDLIEPCGTTLTIGQDTTGTITMILTDENHHCTRLVVSNDEFRELCDVRYKMTYETHNIVTPPRLAMMV
jgi:hypothetical protein